jgi:hypothetical protein
MRCLCNSENFALLKFRQVHRAMDDAIERTSDGRWGLGNCVSMPVATRSSRAWNVSSLPSRLNVRTSR